MRIHEAKAELEKHRNRTDIRLDELVEIANRLISLMVPEQPNDRVSITLSERTVRYYMTEGLIDRPLGKEGTAALYGYRHLLQALIVKGLQGAYLPIRRIKEVLAGRTECELEQILACQPLDNSAGAHNHPLEAMAAEAKDLDIPAAQQKALAYLNYLEQLSSSLTPRELTQVSRNFHPNKVYSSEPPRSPALGLPVAATWERFVLVDGIELHVRTDRRGNIRSSEIKRIIEKILHPLQNWGKEK